MKRNASGALYAGVVFGVALMLAAAGGLAPQAAAATIWQPTDGNVNTTNVAFAFGTLLGVPCTAPSACTNGISAFGIFRPDNSGLDPSLGFLPVDPQVDSVSFTPDGANWDLASSLGTFTLLGSNEFILGATMSTDPATGTWVGDSGHTTLKAGSQYYVRFPTGNVPPATLLATDISAVPLPAALWLFVSGLIGMVGVARRRSDRRQAGPVAPASPQRRRTDRAGRAVGRVGWRAALVAALFVRPGA